MAMTDAEKIRLLTEKLQETVDENDRLRAVIARQAEDTSAEDVLVDIMRNCDLPAAIRTKAASALLPHQKPRLQSVPPPLDLVAQEIVPLAELVERRRARQDTLEPPYRLGPDGHSVILLKGNGRNDGDDDH